MGQISRWLAAKGHEVLLADVSEQMLAIAKEENIKESLQDKIKIVRAAIQELPQLLKGQTFDFILLHGVIEWMENPIEGFECLIPLLKPNELFLIVPQSR
jgi:S-adenosylmethionine-dependent methyltransferase